MNDVNIITSNDFIPSSMNNVFIEDRNLELFIQYLFDLFVENVTVGTFFELKMLN